MNKLNIILSTFCLSIATMSFVACDDDDDDSKDDVKGEKTEVPENPMPDGPTKPASDYELSDSPRSPKKSAKRGVAYNFKNYENADMQLLGDGISWFYNWGNSTSSKLAAAAAEYDLSYFPMCWNASFNQSSIASAVETYNSEYLLAFNEPNLTDQANMTPKQAAEKWPSVLEVAKANNLKIVSPAMNYGTLADYWDPIKWLDEFFTLINPDDIAAISVHCYMPNAAALKGYIDMFAKYGKPIWLTEFCAWDGFNGGESGQREYLSEAVNYLEANPNVERYAWFIPRYTGGNDPKMQLIEGNSLTDRGLAYLGASTQDSRVYYLENQTIQAARFVRCNASDMVKATDNYVATPHYRPTTDESSKAPLDIYHFGVNQWVEYQIELEEEGEYDFNLRANPMVKTKLKISIDGEEIDESITLENTNEWATKHTPLDLKEGKHTVRLTVESGNTAINYLRFLLLE